MGPFSPLCPTNLKMLTYSTLTRKSNKPARDKERDKCTSPYNWLPDFNSCKNYYKFKKNRDTPTPNKTKTASLQLLILQCLQCLHCSCWSSGIKQACCLISGQVYLFLFSCICLACLSLYHHIFALFASSPCLVRLSVYLYISISFRLVYTTHWHIQSKTYFSRSWLTEELQFTGSTSLARYNFKNLARFAHTCNDTCFRNSAFLQVNHSLLLPSKRTRWAQWNFLPMIIWRRVPG